MWSLVRLKSWVQELMLLTGCWRRFWESPWIKRSKLPILKETEFRGFLGRMWCQSWNSSGFGPPHKSWLIERLMLGELSREKGTDRGGDGWQHRQLTSLGEPELWWQEAYGWLWGLEGAGHHYILELNWTRILPTRSKCNEERGHIFWKIR